MAIDERDVSGQKHRLSVDDAEALTGFTKQQVSKWRRRLKERKKYADLLYSAAYAKAMASRPRGEPTRPALAADPWTNQAQKASGSRSVPRTLRADAMLEKGHVDGYAE